MEVPTDDFTKLLADWQQGDRAALERLWPVIRRELYTLAKRHVIRVVSGVMPAIVFAHVMVYTCPRSALAAAAERGASMQAKGIQAAPDDVRAFIRQYFDAWKGTDEQRILAYYSDDVVLKLPTGTLDGKAAVRDNFVRP